MNTFFHFYSIMNWLSCKTMNWWKVQEAQKEVLHTMFNHFTEFVATKIVVR